MKTYTELKIKTYPFDVDLLSGFLWQLDIDGINELEDHLSVFFSVNKNLTIDEFKILLNKLIEERFIESYELDFENIEEKNWNEEYEKNIKVVEITDKIVIKPSFKDYNAKADQIVVIIDPKMSFGTGEHATTQLILKELQSLIKGNEFVLDIGSGTGILGITAVKLGALKAICIDNDEWCYLNGNENVKMNNLVENVDVRLCEINDVKENEFDIILANINKPILINIADEIFKRIKSHGTLVLSGLLKIDEDEIKNLYESKSFIFKKQSEKDEWICIVFDVKK